MALAGEFSWEVDLAMHKGDSTTVFPIAVGNRTVSVKDGKAQVEKLMKSCKDIEAGMKKRWP
eukprot:10352666-Lingulodinium_polyedra.AAC.1